MCQALAFCPVITGLLNFSQLIIEITVFLSFRPHFEDFILFQDFREQFCNIYIETKICKIKINFMRMRTDKRYQREKLSTLYFTVELKLVSSDYPFVQDLFYTVPDCLA